MIRQLSKALLGETAYRKVTQALRAFKFLVRPKHEPEMDALARLIRPGDVVFDIGANYGQYTRVLSRLVGPEGRVYAFEPAEITMQGLARTCRLLRLKNVTLVRVALSSKTGEATLYTPIKSHGGYGIALAHLGDDPRHENLRETVPTMTMDEFIRTQGIDRLAFIKCDVEGAELTVFQSGTESLRRFRPAILSEVEESFLNRHQHSAAQMQAFFDSLGYQAFAWRDGDLRPAVTLGAVNNYFFLPKA